MGILVCCLVWYQRGLLTLTLLGRMTRDETERGNGTCQKSLWFLFWVFGKEVARKRVSQNELTVWIWTFESLISSIVLINQVIHGYAFTAKCCLPLFVATSRWFRCNWLDTVRWHNPWYLSSFSNWLTRTLARELSNIIELPIRKSNAERRTIRS